MPSGYWGTTTTLECTIDLNFQATLRLPFLNCVFCFCFFQNILCLSFKNNFIYLYFIFGCAVFLLLYGPFCSCDVWVSLCSDFPCCRVQFLERGASVVAAPGLQSIDSVVMAHGLSCSTACGIFLNQELKLWPLHWQVDSLPLEKPLSWTLILTKTCSSRYSQQLAQKLNVINPE